LSLNNVFSYDLIRIEYVKNAVVRRCIFDEYKEWLGTSIYNWVLALSNDRGKSEAIFLLDSLMFS
tara:strand:- start:1589 stop:1783 length:195 start_codon:yes stop_codon:yes gene_type:complete